MGPGPFTLRVTDIYGQTVTDTAIPLLNNAEASGASQFPP
jgi:expansin (peptidoglycan-binding protein)